MKTTLQATLIALLVLLGSSKTFAQVSIDEAASKLQLTMEVFFLDSKTSPEITDVKKVDDKNYTFKVFYNNRMPEVEYEGLNYDNGKLTFTDPSNISVVVTEYNSDVKEGKLHWENGKVDYVSFGGKGFSVKVDENGRIVNLGTGYSKTPDNTSESYELTLTYNANGKIAQIDRMAIVAKPNDDARSKYEEGFRYIRNSKTFEYNTDNTFASSICKNYFWKTKKKQKDEVMNNWNTSTKKEGTKIIIGSTNEYTVDNTGNVLTSKITLPSGKVETREFKRNNNGWISQMSQKTVAPDGSLIETTEIQRMYELKANLNPKIKSSYETNKNIKTFNKEGILEFEREGMRSRKLLSTGEMSEWQQILL